MAVLLKNITFWYKKPLFDSLSFEFKSGEISCIYGLNGTGKSTLIYIINGEINLKRGKVYIDSNLKIGTMLQFPENLIYNKTVYDEIFTFTSSKEKTEKIIDELNIRGIKDINPLVISEGQKRIIFIRSILEVFDVAILDEPFASLDMDMKKIIKNMFVDFKNLKKTVIYTTNRKIDTDIADNILELNNERRDNLLGEKGSSG